MHSLEIPELNKRYWIPENLGECDRRQYLDMAKLALMYQMAEISLAEFRVQGLYALLNMEYQQNDLEHIQEEKWENIYRCSELLNSFFTIDEDKKLRLEQDYIHNPVKSVKYKLQTLYGPKDAFEGITYGQLEDGVGELMNFDRTGEIEYLVRLFAIFYHRKYEKYGSYDMEKRVEYFAQLDIRYIYGFYLLFTSFFSYLTKQCVLLIDGKELDLRILFKRADEGDKEKQPADGPESLGLRATSFQLAESGVFGTLNELRETDAMIVLVRMYDLVMRAREQERLIKEQEEQSKNQAL